MQVLRRLGAKPPKHPRKLTMFIWRKKGKTVTRKTEMETVIHCYISFIHFPIFRSMKNTKRKMLFLFRLWRFRIHFQCSAFRFQNKEKDGKQKTENENGFRFCFLSQKTERKNGKRLPLFPFCFIFRFPLFIYWKNNKSRKLTAKTVSAVHFLFPFLFTVLRFSCRYKRKEQKKRKRKTSSAFLLSLFCFQHS